jgi:hypothetical protein
MSFARLPPSSITMYCTCGGAWGVDVTKVLPGPSAFAERLLANAGVVTEINSAAKQVRSGAVAKRRPDRRQFRVNEQLVFRYVFIQTSKGTGRQSSGISLEQNKKPPRLTRRDGRLWNTAVVVSGVVYRLDPPNRFVRSSSSHASMHVLERITYGGLG